MSNIDLFYRYQASFDTFQRAGYSRNDAENLMIKSVQLADEARKRFVSERGDVAHDDIRVALSLGPFGASLFPAQEFDGYYPPPYGPKAFSADGKNWNSFEKDDPKAEVSVDALARFHLERLHVLARREEIWQLVDCVAFETVPLSREVKAIRTAIGRLNTEIGGEFLMKPWWISLVCPSGRFPETDRPGGSNLSIEKVSGMVFSRNSTKYPAPDAIALNCTRIDFLPGLLDKVQKGVDEVGGRAWLVLYPNGGDMYDPVSRTWIVASDTNAKKNIWAETLYSTVRGAGSSPTWGGVLVGGCCRVGPEEIGALYNMISKDN